MLQITTASNEYNFGNSRPRVVVLGVGSKGPYCMSQMHDPIGSNGSTALNELISSGELIASYDPTSSNDSISSNDPTASNDPTNSNDWITEFTKMTQWVLVT